MSEDSTLRQVDLHRIGPVRYLASNARGGVLPIGAGDDPDFTPVELLLAALAGCGAIDVDVITGKRAPAEVFTVHAEGHKVRGDQGNHLVGLTVTFDVRFPDGADGDEARAVMPRTLQQVQERLCTVGRTVALGEQTSYRQAAD